MSTPLRVAVVGGGVAGLYTALALTDPELGADVEITVYGRGWRLGGKCASGRAGGAEDRIEEHGLHVWFGFYDNALRWTRRALDELAATAESGETAPGDCLATLFLPIDEVVLFDEFPEHGNVTQRTPLRLRFPPEGSSPGHHGPGQEDAFGTTVHRVAGVLDTTASSMFAERRPWAPSRLVAPLIGRSARLAVRLVPAGLGAVAGKGPGRLDRARLAVLSGALRTTRSVARPLLRPDRARGRGRRRLLFCGLDLLTAALDGIRHDEVLSRGLGALDGVELRDWLARHGASDTSLGSGSVLWALYDLVFGYHRSDAQEPQLAAGKAVAALVRILGGYRGHVAWRMSSAMGEVVVLPLYLLLRRRGVRFAFFRDLRSLDIDAAGQLQAAILARQVDVDVDGYDPLVTTVRGQAAWPNAPRWEELGLAPGALGTDALENGVEVPGEGVELLELGIDVDVVVLAVPAPVLVERGALRQPLEEASEVWRLALGTSASVATAAFQVWSTERDGSAARLNDRFGSAIVSSYDQPFSTYCAMDHLAAVEGWARHESAPDQITGDGSVRIGYGCGIWPEPPNRRVDALRVAGATAAPVRARETDAASETRASLRRLSGYATVPGAGSGPVGDLAATGVGDAGEAGDVVWTRVNEEAAHRYVTTPPGNPWFRIDPADTGVAGLYAAGDWTANLLDGGCVEAAVVSALRAARGVARAAGVSEAVVSRVLGVVGESTWLDHGGSGAPKEPQERLAWSHPGRVGGLTTVPGPYESAATTLLCWLVRLDPQRTAAMARRCFDEPSGGEIRVEPVGSLGLLTIGDIAAVRSINPAYRGLGLLREQQVVVWVPCRIVRPVESTAVASPDGPFAMFVPYAWVDNPMSLTTGREGAGWPKALGRFPAPDGQTPDFFAPDFTTKPFSLSVYGLADFGPAAEPGWSELLRVDPSGGALPQTIGTAAELAVSLLAAADTAFGVDGRAALESLVSCLGRRVLPQLFSKHIASATDVAADDLRQVVAARARITDWGDLGVLGPSRLTVHDRAGHAVAADLGLWSQDLPVGLAVRLDFVQESGQVLWSSHRR